MNPRKPAPRSQGRPFTRKPAATAPKAPAPATWKADLAFPEGLAALEPPASFTADAAALGLAFEPGELDQLGRYLAMLLKTNESMNLTAIRDPAEAWSRHILDSLSIIPVIAEAAETAGRDDLTLIDVGTGAGLPGLPLAIAMPNLRVTLLDATDKKCAFLRHVAAQLGLNNVTVLHQRAERAAHEAGRRVDEAGATRRDGALRAGFDLVTARAVGRLATLLELTVPFARVGGLCVLIKGEKAAEELEEARQALHLLHAAHAGTIDTPTGRVVVVEKLRDTPRDYPRADGEPKRKPLGT